MVIFLTVPCGYLWILTSMRFAIPSVFVLAFNLCDFSLELGRSPGIVITSLCHCVRIAHVLVLVLVQCIRYLVEITHCIWHPLGSFTLLRSNQKFLIYYASYTSDSSIFNPVCVVCVCVCVCVCLCVCGVAG